MPSAQRTPAAAWCSASARTRPQVRGRIAGTRMPVTPAAVARATAASRSAANAGTSRWQWLSIIVIAGLGHRRAAPVAAVRAPESTSTLRDLPETCERRVLPEGHSRETSVPYCEPSASMRQEGIHMSGSIRSVALAAAVVAAVPSLARGDEVKVGVLHSLSGTMSISEITVKNATLLAIDEINAAGGVLGKKLAPVI